MNPALSQKLRRGEGGIGTWLSLGSPVVAELAAECGFGWLLFDLEHGCAAEDGLRAAMQAVRAPGCAAVVRVPRPDSALIGRMLDWGAHGIMVPHVSSGREAEEIVRATRYVPRGGRGYSRTVRAYGYGLRPPAEGDGAADPVVIAQIESREGVENAEEIAAVDGVDVLFVGPADLNAELAARPGGPAYPECLERVAAAARSRGKQAGILLREPGEAARFREQGYRVLALNSDLAVLRAGFLGILQGAAP